MNDQKCSKCSVPLRPYFLRDGICNGCRNPHLIVVSMPECDHEELDHGCCLTCGRDLNGVMDSEEVFRRDRS